ncbi:20552_t:CDS:2 [Gigaspora rosea]|nr:20552_t:CDS:2 [Gigaspora rosea]
MSSSNNFTSTHELNTSNYSNNITEDNIQRFINKSKSKILTPVHKNLDQTQHIKMTEDRTPFKNVQDQAQDIEMTKNRIPFKNIQDRTQNIKPIFNFHNPKMLKL